MLSKQLITSNPDFHLPKPIHNQYLEVAEFFCDTIQGENFIGYPSAFLRLQHCTLSCSWCDTQEVWRFGNPYTFKELFDKMTNPEFDLINKLRAGQHLVITGGSPLRQQERLVYFLQSFFQKFIFHPTVEIENECTIMPTKEMEYFVDTWNNSPKLESSGNLKEYRYRPEVIKHLSELRNSWFKFVIKEESEWKEIQEEFLHPELIHRRQIVLMPQGATRSELFDNQEAVVEMAIRHNVRYCSREHIVLWDKKTGV